MGLTKFGESISATEKAQPRTGLCGSDSRKRSAPPGVRCGMVKEHKKASGAHRSGNDLTDESSP